MKAMQLKFGAGALMLIVATGGTGFGAEPPEIVAQPPSGDTAVTLVDETVELPCIPVAAYWTGAPKSEGMPPGPDLAVVSTNIRPKDARVHLDRRFVGRARYLDGRPGYLYLEPGAYRLEIQMGGYRSVLIELDVTAGCRYDLNHRMERVSGTVKEKKGDPPGKGEPFHRVFGPAQAGPEQNASAAGPAGPDSALRSDLAPVGRAPQAVSASGGALRLRIHPDGARVMIDGAFVATGRELHRMEGALATDAGRHRLEVTAPGYLVDSRYIEISEGETLNLDIELTSESTNDSD